MTIALTQLLGLALLLPGSIAIAAAPNCGIVTIHEFGGVERSEEGPPRRPEIELRVPGKYCLDVPVLQPKLMERSGAREMTTLGGDGIILIGEDDVDLDLGGQLVSNERSLGYTLIKHYRYEPGRRQAHWFARTRISNGKLRSPGSRGIGMRLVAANRYGPAGFGTAAAVPPGEDLPDVLLDTRHRIEGLDIAAGRRAILIDGRNNTIRNNHIVVDGVTAIVAQGPGLVLEDNVIEVRGDLRGFSDHDRKLESRTPFPIRLIQADDAIVRNNRIRLIDRTAGPGLPAAIELVRSRNVTVEGNRFEGMDQGVSADPHSSHLDNGNEASACASAATRYLPPDEAGGENRQRTPACR